MSNRKNKKASVKDSASEGHVNVLASQQIVESLSKEVESSKGRLEEVNNRLETVENSMANLGSKMDQILNAFMGERANLNLNSNQDASQIEHQRPQNPSSESSERESDEEGDDDAEKKISSVSDPPQNDSEGHDENDEPPNHDQLVAEWASILEMLEDKLNRGTIGMDEGKWLQTALKLVAKCHRLMEVKKSGAPPSSNEQTIMKRLLEVLEGMKSSAPPGLIEWNECGLTLQVRCGTTAIKETAAKGGYQREELVFPKNGVTDEVQLLNLFGIFDELDRLASTHGYSAPSLLLLLRENLCGQALEIAKDATNLEEAMRLLLRRYARTSVVESARAKVLLMKQHEKEGLYDFVKRVRRAYAPHEKTLPSFKVYCTVKDHLLQAWKVANVLLYAEIARLDKKPDTAWKNLIERSIEAKDEYQPPNSNKPGKNNGEKNGQKNKNAAKQSSGEKKDGAPAKKDDQSTSGEKKKTDAKADAKTDAKTCEECGFNLPKHKFGCTKFVAQKKSNSVSKAAVGADIDWDAEVWGVAAEQIEPHKQYIEFVLPNTRQIRMEIDTGAGESIVPAALIERLKLSNQVSVQPQVWCAANGSELNVSGYVDFPFIAGDGEFYSFLVAVSPDVKYPLLNWDLLRKHVPGCEYHSKGDAKDDTRKIANISLVKDETGTWLLPKVTGKMVCTLIGDSRDEGEDPEIDLPVLMDPKEILAAQRAEIPRILESCKADGCPDAVVDEIKALLEQAVTDHANLVTKLPPSRGELDYDIKIVPGKRPVKSSQWPERNPDALEARKEWEKKMEQSGRIYFTTPDKVSAISNVTCPKQKDSYRPCGAYNDLNNITAKEERDMPVMKDVLMSLKPNTGALFVSDINKGFNTIRQTEETQKLTALWSVTRPGQVLVSHVMMFGTCNAPAAFDKLMDRALQGCDLKRIVDDVHGEGVYPPGLLTEDQKNDAA